eukprot:gene4905-6116_t
MKNNKNDLLNEKLAEEQFEVKQEKDYKEELQVEKELKNDGLDGFFFNIRPPPIVCFVAPCPGQWPDGFWWLERINDERELKIKAKIEVVGEDKKFDLNKIKEDYGSFVVYGNFKPQISPGDRVLVVERIYKGIPNNQVVVNEKISKKETESEASASVPKKKMYSLRNSGLPCVAEPCIHTFAIELNSKKGVAISKISEPYTKNVPYFDIKWHNAWSLDPELMVNEIEVDPLNSHANIVRSFARVVNPGIMCPAVAKIVCPEEDMLPVFNRLSDRCFEPAGCIRYTGTCPPYSHRPLCTPGFRLTENPRGGYGCPQYFCDWDFLDPVEVPK